MRARLVAVLAPLLVLAASPPVTRDGARRAAHRELGRSIYQRGQPPWWARLASTGLGYLRRALSGTAALAPGGGLGLLVILVLLVLVVLAVRMRVGPLGRRHALFEPAPQARAWTAQDHRREADRLAAEAQWAGAVRERLRAIVRELESRGAVDPRPGGTAMEVAREGGVAVPEVSADLRAAATVFDEIWYGGRTATADSDARLREVDQRVAAARLSVMAGRR